MEELKKMAASAEEMKCVALGAEDLEELVEIDPQPQQEPATMEQKIEALEVRLTHMTQSLDCLFQILKEIRDESRHDRDQQIDEAIKKKKKEQKVEIPEGTTLHGSSRGLNYFCQVRSDGFYIGETRYDSLSAAAAAVSGVRRSGLAFWRMPEGKTVKETYKE